MPNNFDDRRYQNTQKDMRSDKLALVNKKLAFQNAEKEKRADELVLANEELAFQNNEKDKRADELVLANTEKDKRADELVLANKEKDKRADELVLANKEKEKRADELILANEELAFQNTEKDKRADELVLANKEKEKRADELILANKELAFQNKEKEKRADELILANKELAFQKELDGYRSEMERVAQDLTLLIDTANAPIFGIDAEGNVNEWNQKSAEITGYDADEVMGKSLVYDFIRENYRESVNDVLQKALKGYNTSNYEFPLYTKNNNLVRVLLNATTRRNAEGSIVGVIGVGQDITAESLARKESERSSGELKQLIDTANAPIFGIDAVGRVTEWNQSAARMSGFEQKEVLGRDLVQDFITEEYKSSVKEVFDNALQGEETANFEFPLYTKKGSRLDVLLNASARRDLEGNIIGIIGVGQDVSLLKEKESSLRQAQKMEAVGQLTGGLAHDFNNLLGIIQGNLRFLQDDLGDVDDDTKLLFEDALSAVSDGTELTGRLLQFSSHRNQQQLVQEVNGTVEKFYRLMSRTIGEKISLVLNLPEEKLFVSVDSSQLENSLVNLVINARDAMPNGGEISITAEKIDYAEAKQAAKHGDINESSIKEFVKITVSDQGVGIERAIISRITEPFFTTKDVGAGTGLGLSMVYSFLKTSAGFLRINSKVGVGTKVEMYLPSARKAKHPSAEAVAKSSESFFSKTILVVEDEPRVRRVTIRDLRELNYKTIEAGDADMAMSIIQSGEKIDLVFSDILMPGDTDGRMLGNWVEEHYPYIKVVLISGYSKGKGKGGIKGSRSAKEAAKYMIVRKPYSINELAGIIGNMFTGD